ncbi:MAG: glutamate 5-kinase [Planctomycetia bacterium]|nr:glutamate 5-kinase [Planctomycetia bacterium]
MISLSRQEIVQTVKYVVIKVGTNILTHKDGLLNFERIHSLVEEIVAIRARGINVVLVSSGAVGAGMGRLGLTQRPKSLTTLQAVAAIGQGALIQFYEEELAAKGVPAAQILLTAGDLSIRHRYLNMCNTMHALFNFGTLPIINENDAVSSAEISLTFGENDRLASLVANLFPEPLLILLTDVDGLYDADPSTPEAKVISVVDKWSPKLLDLVAKKKSSRSKGGMETKLRAARTVVNAGGAMIIANGNDPKILSKIFAAEDCGTIFYPNQKLSARERWFRSASAPKGKLVLDAGAIDALLNQGKSLLPIGVIRVDGEFRQGDVVSMVDQAGKELARGLVNYNFHDAQKICRKRSDELAQALQTDAVVHKAIVHRDNLELCPAEA